jgi:hypothetical protein
MILELTPEESLIFNSLVESGLCDFAIIGQMFDIFGITTRIIKNSEVAKAVKGGVAS